MNKRLTSEETRRMVRPEAGETVSSLWPAPSAKLLGAILDSIQGRPLTTWNSGIYNRVAAWQWDLRTDDYRWGPGFRQLFGFEEGEPASYEKWLTRVHPDDIGLAESSVMAAIREGRCESPIRYRMVQSDGSVRWIYDPITIEVDGQGVAERVSGVCVDVTSLKEVEAELESAKAEAERAHLANTKFLAAASHDLRQPVQSLMLFLSALKPLCPTEQQQKLIGMASLAVGSLSNLLTTLLDIARLDANTIIPAPVETELGSLLGKLAAEYDLRAAERGLELRHVPTRLTVRTDPALLERLLRNLLENALRYTPAGVVLIGCRRRQGQIGVSVVDTGEGIPREKLSNIFEEFVQLGQSRRDAAQGLGLGLSIVKRLCSLLGATVSVRSALDRGSAFTVWLPAA